MDKDRANALSKTQRSVLEELVGHGMAFADHYPPVKKLRELGYIKFREVGYSGVYEITETGRAALSQASVSER
jgi:DNA-binding PadR family transcriptional regulator